MNTFLLRVVLALAALFSFVACVGMPMNTYSEPRATGGSYYDDDGYSGSTSSSGYYGGNNYGGNSYYGGGYNRPTTFIHSGYGYGSGYYGGGVGVCTVCRRSPCRCARTTTTSHHHDDHCDVRGNTGRSPSRQSSHNHGRSSSDDKKDDTKWRYRGSAPAGKPKPEGNHTREWFKDRGYSLKKLQKTN
jgi:hypothetical protein